MRVISLLQPWATLVVIGAKRIETRGKNCNHRGELFIHASQGKYYYDGFATYSCRELCYKEPFNKFIKGGPDYDKLPTGAIIGKVNLKNTAPTWQFDNYVKHFRSSITDFMESGVTDWEQEYAFGDFGPNRYGYFLSDNVQFKKPIPAKGKQAMTWECPKEIEQQVLKMMSCSI